MRLKITLTIIAGLCFSSPCYSADDYILINKSKKQAYIIRDDKIVEGFAVGIGKKGYETPSGKFKIINKIKNPQWNPSPDYKWLNNKTKEYIRKHGSIPSESPLNPLGKYWLGISSPNIGIHDIDNNLGIGRASSHGCIRVKTKSLESLFEKIPIGTKVKIINK